MQFKKSSKIKPKLHQVVIVGGGAGGLELATRLGDKLGKKNKSGILKYEETALINLNN